LLTFLLKETVKVISGEEVRKHEKTIIVSFLDAYFSIVVSLKIDLRMRHLYFRGNGVDCWNQTPFELEKRQYLP